MIQFYDYNFYIILGEIIGRQQRSSPPQRCGWRGNATKRTQSQDVDQRWRWGGRVRGYIEGIPRPAGKYSYGLTDTYT